MIGICRETGGTAVLEKSREYFLFEHGPNYYVSKFNNVKAHFGSFKREYFEVLEDSPAVEEVKKTNRFVAFVSKYRMGYRLGDEYIIGPHSTDSRYFNVYLLNGRIIGSYIDQFLEVIGPYQEPEPKPKAKPEPIPEPEPEQKPEVIEPIVAEPEIKQPKKAKINKDIPDGQMDIFDFLEDASCI